MPLARVAVELNTKSVVVNNTEFHIMFIMSKTLIFIKAANKVLVQPFLTNNIPKRTAIAVRLLFFMEVIVSKSSIILGSVMRILR